METRAQERARLDNNLIPDQQASLRQSAMNNSQYEHAIDMGALENKSIDSDPESQRGFIPHEVMSLNQRNQKQEGINPEVPMSQSQFVQQRMDGRLHTPPATAPPAADPRYYATPMDHRYYNPGGYQRQWESPYVVPQTPAVGGLRARATQNASHPEWNNGGQAGSDKLVRLEGGIYYRPERPQLEGVRHWSTRASFPDLSTTTEYIVCIHVQVA